MARTNIELDDRLLAETIWLSEARAKRDAVHKTLEEFVANRSRPDPRELPGTVEIREEHDYKRLREGRG
ncbi:MAG: type II toxin-antitoxin system VapB family antitoxin [Chloroflexia bacterium]|nr:type II toxin-antitoxin system VapB family antitoxin [Chloroflexia bacterium]